MSFLLWVVVGLIAGWQTGRRMRGYGYGPLMDGVMGAAGGVMGGFIAGASGFSATANIIFSVLGALLGAVTATGITGLASGRSRFA